MCVHRISYREKLKIEKIMKVYKEDYKKYLEK